MPALAVRFSLGVVLIAAGCVAASPPYSERDLRVRCESNGGRWHAALKREGFCEFQSPGMI
jgi:hypothetical protein